MNTEPLMSVEEATRIVLRLQGHFPSLAPNDEASEDWIRTVAATPDADEVAEALVFGWTRDRAPRLADWQELRRTHGLRVWAEVESAMRQEKLQAGPPATPAAIETVEQVAASTAKSLTLEPAHRVEPIVSSPRDNPNHLSRRPVFCQHLDAVTDDKGDYCPSCTEEGPAGSLVKAEPS